MTNTSLRLTVRDGRRATLRNRKFLRKFKPFVSEPEPLSTVLEAPLPGQSQADAKKQVVLPENIPVQAPAYTPVPTPSQPPQAPLPASPPCHVPPPYNVPPPCHAPDTPALQPGPVMSTGRQSGVPRELHDYNKRGLKENPEVSTRLRRRK